MDHTLDTIRHAHPTIAATMPEFDAPPRPGPPPASAWIDDLARDLLAAAMAGAGTGWKLINTESRPRARAYVRRLRHLSNHVYRHIPVRLSTKTKGHQLWVMALSRE